MFRANIYYTDPLLPEVQDSIASGIDMIAGYMGHTVVSSLLGVRLPINNRGRVNPERISFRKLDKMVELHLMAVPLETGDDDQLGLAGLGSGWSFVNILEENVNVIRLTAAHEVGHAMGFVTRYSMKEKEGPDYHCVEQKCIMYKGLIVNREEAYQQEPALKQKLKIGFPKKNNPELSRNKRSQTNIKQQTFCKDCIQDLKTNGEKNLEELRYDRLFRHKGIRQ